MVFPRTQNVEEGKKVNIDTPCGRKNGKTQQFQDILANFKPQDGEFITSNNDTFITVNYMEAHDPVHYCVSPNLIVNFCLDRECNSPRMQLGCGKKNENISATDGQLPNPDSTPNISEHYFPCKNFSLSFI